MERLRRAEVVGTLSLATDLGMGQPLGWAQRTALLSVRFGETIGLNDADLQKAYYLALLRFIGCTADSHVAAQFFGDEVASRTWITPAWSGSQAEMLGAIFQNVGAGLAPWDRVRQLMTTFTNMPGLMASMRAHCEVAVRLAERLGFDEEIREAVTQGSERWDGRGGPRHLKGEETVLPMRLVQLVQDAEIAHRTAGAEAVVATLRRHAQAHDPSLLERFCANVERLFAGLEEEVAWETALAAEPGPVQWIAEEDVERALETIGDFTDLKSPYTSGHSRGVATLAAEAARVAGLPAGDAKRLALAGLLHDVGRVAVTSAIWTKPRTLTEGERDSVHLHPYYTQRVLARPQSLAPLGTLAALHHERLDGSGYHRSVPVEMQPVEAQLLAVADAYQAMSQPRPHRAEMAPEAIVQTLRGEVRAGKLDGTAVDAVLRAAGHRVRTAKSLMPAGLSERELDVLRLLARGNSNREMGRRLYISDRTVQHHVEHIYEKIGVSTRAAATLFAMQHRLLDGAEE